jgi:hypothetical protein
LLSWTSALFLEIDKIGIEAFLWCSLQLSPPADLSLITDTI